MLGLMVTCVSLMFGGGYDRGMPTLPSDSTKTITIHNVFILGNKKTNESIILREMEIEAEATYTRKELAIMLVRDRERIYNTRLFNTVEIEMVSIDEESADIIVKVHERWYIFPSPILEIADRNISDWWVNENHDLGRLNYGLRLDQLNVRGRNETLRFIAKLGYSKKFGLRYSIPYLDKSQKNGLVMNFSYGENTNLAYRTVEHKREFFDSEAPVLFATQVGITYRIRRSFYEYHYVDFNFRNTSITDSLISLNSNYFGNNKNEQRIISLAYGYRNDKRDVIAYPLTGFMGEFNIKKVGVGVFDDVNYTTLFARYSRYSDLGKKNYLANHFAGYANIVDNISYNQYYGLGYEVFFVRGYELYVVEGQKYFLNKNSFKRLLFSTTTRIERAPLEQFRHFPLQLYLKTYFDWGYVQNFPNYDANRSLSDRIIYGGGIGLDLVTAYDVVFRGEYSFNDIGESGFFFHLKKEF